MELKIRERIRVYGIVQGVGFRPFVARLAADTGVCGSVCNKGPYVEIFAEGDRRQVETFRRRLKTEAPERSAILKLEAAEVPLCHDREFQIIHSKKVKGEIFVSPDIATCPKCRKELFDPHNRRYLHPFINCTACGPRLTILDSMPYDRERTSMAEFPMCPECRYEYTHPETRRYHAQPVCCNQCGPELYIVGREDVRGADALVYTRSVIRDGGIAAVKGIGGFHLCCDASNEAAVSRLRKLKDRPWKPFAVMLRDMDTVRRECDVMEGQEKILDGPSKPILLLRKKTGGKETRLCESVAPENPNVGVMLPYAPVQMLLFDYPDGKPMTDCFVMTSGNPKGAPICREDQEVRESLGYLCDIILSNNRKIRLRADDSVMNWQDGKPSMIRRSRGYAPLPLILSGKYRGKVLGIGGELKNTFCLGADGIFYPSPYIGDLSDMRGVTALRQAVGRMETLLEIRPEVIACDLHPRYQSSKMAEALAEADGVPLVRVQHHYAHVLSCMAENDRRDPVIGVAFDGTGYGTDGTVWGGEFLIADVHSFRRAGSVGSFVQAGGDLAPREGWRIAAAVLRRFASDGARAAEMCEKFGICSEEEYRILDAMIRNNINCIRSTSAGRLFDGASAVLGFRRKSSCEGEASMVLEFAAEAYAKRTSERERDRAYAHMLEQWHAYVISGEKFELPAEDLFWYLAEQKLAGEDPEKLAWLFHRAVADIVLAGCRVCREQTGIGTAALSGGVMQNMLLLFMCRALLRRDGFEVLTHSMIPANDGGIGLGQALYASGLSA